jgi:integrase
LSNATILKIHYMFSGTFAAAIRWEWIQRNPADVAKKPRQPVPMPNPPSPEDVARIIEAAWDQDKAWGTLVWLVMVTGMRRSELLPLRWRDVDLDCGKLTIYSSKTHRQRKISLDVATVEVLAEHYDRYKSRMDELGITATSDAHLFSASPTCDKPFSPSWVTHRYGDMCADLGSQLASISAPLPADSGMPAEASQHSAFIPPG